MQKIYYLQLINNIYEKQITTCRKYLQFITFTTIHKIKPVAETTGIFNHT